MYLTSSVFGQLPMSPDPICQSVSTEENSECVRRLVAREGDTG